jgi:DNA-directed RNA polymerase subunit H (RpoH/RPB5)
MPRRTLQLPASIHEAVDDEGVSVSVSTESQVLSADQIANDLGLQRAEVVELMRQGELPARRIGSELFTTSEKLVEFVARADPRDSLPRYRTNDPVVALNDDGDLIPGRYGGETEDGRILVVCTGLLWERKEAFAPEQVQPLTVRIPEDRTH